MVASASFDFLRWVRVSWAAFRESGWNIFSFLEADLGLEVPAITLAMIGVGESDSDSII